MAIVTNQPATVLPTPVVVETSLSPPAPPDWTAQDSENLYRVDEWGQGYFGINTNGHLEVRPTKAPSPAIDLRDLIDGLRQRGLALPLLLRFSDVLRSRVKEIHDAFNNAITEHEYRGAYKCVYPIKVNQQRHVVEEILNFGRPYGFGLEVGSKPELLAVMAMVDDDQTPIICNGFKDDQFIEAVILAAKIGKNIIPVVEKFSELELIAKYASLHGVHPSIGIRVKLAAQGAGRWEQSSGVRSKFGLFVSEVVDAMDYLRNKGMQGCLKLLHFHLGSQINDICSIKTAITEMVRVYVELQNNGAALEYLDVGGGLGVDYDGSNTRTESSINYSLQEYANNIVFHIKETCDQIGVKHPTIISESGRALAAYHSVLVFNVTACTGYNRFQCPASLSDQQRKDAPAPVVNLFDAYHGLSQDNFVEYYHDVQLARNEALNLFNLGYCSLEDRALAERLFFGICSKILQIVRQLDQVPEEFDNLQALLADTYFCNVSIFQSLPDSWAVDQRFPIMPVHRLNEKPTARGVLVDITCDSDGKIDHFIDRRDCKNVLELHDYTGDDYYLAACLVGAYQEILGDMHNLFGDTNAVHVSLDEHGKPSIDEVVQGDTVREVLQYVQFSTDELTRAMRKRVEQALRNNQLSIDEARLLLRFYDTGLEGYTYLS